MYAPCCRGQNIDPQSMDYPDEQPKWTTLKFGFIKRVDKCWITTVNDGNSTFINIFDKTKFSHTKLRWEKQICNFLGRISSTLNNWNVLDFYWCLSQKIASGTIRTLILHQCGLMTVSQQDWHRATFHLVLLTGPNALKVKPLILQCAEMLI